MNKLEYYHSKKAGWRWRFKSRNGRILADSGEGYTSLAKAEKGYEAMARSICASKVKTFVN